MEELKKTIATLFKKKGGPKMTEKEFVLFTSMDLRWFPPRDAQKLLEVALKKGFVSLGEGYISPNFDVSKVEIPLNFTPKESVLSPPEEKDAISDMLAHILSVANVEKKDIVSRINSIQERMGIEIEVAALIVGESLNVDMSGFLDKIEEEILSRIRS